MAFPSSDVGKLRRQLGLDCDEFAKLVGVNSRSVRRWELDGKPDKIPGSAGDVLTALRYGLQKDRKALLGLIAGALAIGGLAFIMIKLLDGFFAGQK